MSAQKPQRRKASVKGATSWTVTLPKMMLVEKSSGVRTMTAYANGSWPTILAWIMFLLEGRGFRKKNKFIRSRNTDGKDGEGHGAQLSGGGAGGG